ncbi:MAG: hypothetical protein HY800_03150, partial [Ignavibacteriales bacterium]|nr:hypothetical protein [Ignavibacteriales bacterium]
MLKLLFWIILIAVIILGGLFLYSFIQPPAEGKTPDESKAIKIVLQNMKSAEPNWQTIVVVASREVNLQKSTVWNTWINMNDWKRWAPQLVVSAEWIGSPGWIAGASFEQVLNLGFPLFKTTSTETVSTVSPERSVCWEKNTGSLQTCHLWMFEDVPNGKTRVINVE